jgi:hypothetical protein
MKFRSYETGVLCAVAFLLIGSAAFAQTTTASKPASQTSSAGAVSGRKSGSVIIVDREASSGTATQASSVTTAREASSGMATGRREASTGQASGRQDQFPKASGAIADENGNMQAAPNAKNSAHATESLATQSGSDQKHKAGMSGAQSNPLYQSSGTSGTNPLYEPKDRSTVKTGGSGTPAPVQYKDGEDGTTRTRPGSNKVNK